MGSTIFKAKILKMALFNSEFLIVSVVNTAPESLTKCLHYPPGILFTLKLGWPIPTGLTLQVGSHGRGFQRQNNFNVAKKNQEKSQSDKLTLHRQEKAVKLVATKNNEIE